MAFGVARQGPCNTWVNRAAPANMRTGSMAAGETWLGRGWLMPDERANEEQGPVGTPIETDQLTNKRAAEVAPSAAQGPPADAPNVALSAKPTDAASIERSEERRVGKECRSRW